MRRAALAAAALAAVFAVFWAAGPRAALLLATGIGFGLVLEGLGFGFAGPWRRMWAERDARGLNAQLLAIAATAALAFPLLAAHPGELMGAHAPVGLAMVGGAFVFGAAMQIVMGCGSGTLVNAGSGNLVGAVALAGFIGGSFAGTLHLGWWTDLGHLPVLTLQGLLGGPQAGLAATLAGLGLIGLLAARRARPRQWLPQRRLWLAAALVAVLALANLAIAGQPWGIVYGLGLWGAKLAGAAGVDLSGNAFWGAPAHAERLSASVLTDVTSLTNIGLMLGAWLVLRWRAGGVPQVARLAPGSWLAVLVAGGVLGYSARLAFGCNVGAFFSGVSTGSLHGWVWFVAAFAGSGLGLRLRAVLLRAPAPHAGATP